MKISVVIPVYREEKLINSAVSGLKEAAAGREAEIIIVDGGPGQTTLENTLDREVVRVVSKPGRGAQMNAGAAMATGDVLLFLHADTSLPAGAFGLIERALAGSRAEAGAFTLAIDSSDPVLKFIAHTANIRTKLFRTPFGDQAIFFKTKYFKSLGGFKDIPLMEDVEMMKRIRKKGGSIALIGAPVTTSDRRWRREGLLYVTLRNKAVRGLYALGFAPERLAHFYLKEAGK